MTDADKNSSEKNSELINNEPTMVKVWDLPVRIFHWALVILFIAAYVTNSLGVNYFKYHLWCGYAMIVLVCFRIIWGFVGTYHARFINFVKNPLTTTKYAVGFFKKDNKHYIGHNPLGALMVLALLIALLVQAVTGLFGNDEIVNLGPLYGYISDELSLKLTSLHRTLFYWILGAVVLHIAAVLFHLWFKRDNILKAMFTGTKKCQQAAGEKPVSSSKTWLAAIIVICLIALLAWIIIHAPEAVSVSDY